MVVLLVVRVLGGDMARARGLLQLGGALLLVKAPMPLSLKMPPHPRVQLFKVQCLIYVLHKMCCQACTLSA